MVDLDTTLWTNADSIPPMTRLDGVHPLSCILGVGRPLDGKTMTDFSSPDYLGAWKPCDMDTSQFFIDNKIEPYVSNSISMQFMRKEICDWFMGDISYSHEEFMHQT